MQLWNGRAMRTTFAELEPDCETRKTTRSSASSRGRWMMELESTGPAKAVTYVPSLFIVPTAGL